MNPEFRQTFEHTVERIKNNDPLLIHVNLNNCNSDFAEIDDNDAIALAEALKSNTHLTELIIRSTKFTNRTAYAFAEALKTNTGLTKFEICGDNAINNEGKFALWGEEGVLDYNDNLLDLTVWGEAGSSNDSADCSANKDAALRLAKKLRSGVEQINDRNIWKIKRQESAIKAVASQQLEMPPSYMKEIFTFVDNKLSEKLGQQQRPQEAKLSQPEEPSIKIYSANYKGKEFDDLKAQLFPINNGRS